ncbi:MAG: dihydrofolate reductase [Bacteroidetes bacterium]|nr:MAG: dihydrofolate reductase [Bacteroidota bacterium]
MLISIIVAQSLNRVIGKNNQLAWHLPADLKMFKQKTSQHHILMGRKTFESIGKALPNRTNLVLSRDHSLKIESCLSIQSIEKGIDLAKKANESELFIIGGAEIYCLALPLAQKIYLTEIQTNIDGDAFFPELNDFWKEVSREKHFADEKNIFDYDFVVFEKI